MQDRRGRAHSFSFEPIEFLAAGLFTIALLVGGCAAMREILFLSNDQVVSMLPTDVKRIELRNLSPRIALYLKAAHGAEFGDSHITIVSDVLLRDLFAKARLPEYITASFWDVRAVVDSHLPSLSAEIVYGLSHGEDYLLLVSESFAKDLGKLEELILVHENAHKYQYDQERYARKGTGRIDARPLSMQEYLAQRSEREAYTWEIRYAQTVLGMNLKSYLSVRTGSLIDQYFLETIEKLWHEVEQQSAKNSLATSRR